MTIEPVRTLSTCLQRYEQAIDITRDHLTDLRTFGDFPAYLPYYEREVVMARYDNLARSGADIPVSLWSELRRVEAKFRALEREGGTHYRKHLLEDLSTFIQIYQAAICFSTFGGEDSAHAAGRERLIISILSDELKKDHDLAATDRHLDHLDNMSLQIARSRHDQASDPTIIGAIPSAGILPRERDQGIP